MRNTLKLGGKRLGKENWTFYSVNNEPLFVNNEHKAKWYLKKNLVEIIGERKVRFFKETKVKSVLEDDFLLSPIERKCVVCGTDVGLQKHHVVPHMYRKYMPEEYKSNNHHDVVILCYEHHYFYEINHSEIVKTNLALKHGLKTIQELCKERTENMRPHLLAIQKCRTLLKHNVKLPVNKIIELTKMIIERTPMLNNYEYDILTEEELEMALEYHTNILEQNTEVDYVGKEHALKIIQYHIDNKSLYDFVLMWRKDFIDNMKPKHMPLGWDLYRKEKIFD